MGRKHCGKKRKCWEPAFSIFPTMFSECFFFMVVKSQEIFAINNLTLFSSIPNDKILGWSKLKAFAEDKSNATKKLKFVQGGGKKTWWEKAKMLVKLVTSIFLLFPQCFQEASFPGSFEVRIVL